MHSPQRKIAKLIRLKPPLFLMEQLGYKRKKKREQRWKPTLRQLVIFKAIQAYRSNNLQLCLTLLQQNNITTVEFLTELASMERLKKRNTRF